MCVSWYTVVCKSGSVAILVLVACGGHRGSGSAATSGGSTSCPDAALEPLVPPREAGLPTCVALGDASCPMPEASAEPRDAANWLCYTDRDCAVFPEAPYCDRFGCSASQASITCIEGAQDRGGLPNPEVSHTYVGTNGTFADHCDADGNLIDYQCEKTYPPCTTGPNCWSLPVETGDVVPLPQLVDCGGTCSGARCDGRCPQQADQITFQGRDMDGREIVHNDSDGRTYVCTLNASAPNTSSFDCTTIAVSQAGYVYGLGLTGTYCTSAAVFGSVGVVLDGVPTPAGSSTCFLSCAIHYTNNCSSP